MSQANSVWIADDDRSIRWVLEKALTQAGIITRCFENGDELLGHLEGDVPDAIISDIRMPGIDGLKLLSRITAAHPGLPVIITTAHSDLDSAVASYQGGAFEYLPKPFDVDEAVATTQRALQHANKNRNLLPEQALLEPTEIIGEAPAMQEVFRAIGRLSQSNITVLINGESGTGKELVARQLHLLSGRSGAFVPVNCGAIAPDLLASELFGHTAGAFTGAKGNREGLFSYASGGTIFLDEIGEMPMNMQTALLRVLEQRAIRPVGSEKEVDINVRVIAATNRLLIDEVEAGRFRRDLFYRLNVLNIVIPSLRSRPDDVAELTHYFTLQLSQELGIKDVIWSHEDLQVLQQHDWPGNIRELRNMIERCILLGKPPAEYWKKPASVMVNDAMGYPLNWPLKEVEKQHVTKVVDNHNGNKSAAARDLGVSRKTLDRKFKDWLNHAEEGHEDT